MKHLWRLMALLLLLVLGVIAQLVSAAPAPASRFHNTDFVTPACNPPVPALQPSVCVPLSFGGPPTSSTPHGAQGVDVSDFQGSVHWSAAKRSGVRWAYAQFGDGQGFRDATFAANWRELVGLRIPHGAYLFLRPGDGVQQARALATAIKTSGIGDRTLPAVLDAEVPESYQQVCSAVSALRKTLGWREVIVYTAPGLWLAGVPHCAAGLWVADYGVLVPAVAWGWQSWVAWQYEVGFASWVGGKHEVDRDVATGILKLSYGRTVELPRVEGTRRVLRAHRHRQQCHQALHGVKRLASHKAECRRELRKGSRLTRRSRQLAHS
ncbi:MAG TPA: glycoside hydrolase family 25 protein [Solirubrobacteraceae bacterium]|jgi:GH25 family lysozyme M1 (1,4-beta-N-acetylmuramidase)